MQAKHIILTILFITSAIFYYQITDPVNITTAKVIQITDGDTLKTNEPQTLRLLGINTPEKNQPFYQEAKEFLTQKTQNKTIQIQSYGLDKYKRTLSYIFLENQNINAQILNKGLATLYYYDKDKYYKELKLSEEFARLNNLGIWKKSPDSSCIQIIEFKTNEPELLILQNNCNHQINLTYKDDATHIYKATIDPNSIYTKTFSHIWNTDGDSIYIYDTKGLLIFHRYN
jgi:micrococcal nuclease